VASDDVESPCINICRMDLQTNLCAGCFRTTDEITAWARYSNDEKRAVLARLSQRRQTHGKRRSWLDR
jgi:predicted Fe-S protein YdhL (DUF1289 family)